MVGWKKAAVAVPFGVLSMLVVAVTPASATVTGAGVLSGNDTFTKWNTVYYKAREVDRDCGYSNKLESSNVSLWVFCDSWIYDQLKTSPYNWDYRPVTEGISGDPKMGGTAGIDDTGTGYVKEGVSGAWSMPGSFMHPDTDATNCVYASGAPKYEADWAKGTVTIPGTDSVLLFFQTMCVQSSSSWGYYNAGVVTYSYTSGLHVPSNTTTAPPVQTVDSSTRYPNLFTNPSPGTNWNPYTSAPVFATDGGQQYLYVYSAIQGGGNLNIARVPFTNASDTRYQSASNYSKLTGSGWLSLSSATAASNLFSAAPYVIDNISVQWSPQKNKYVMVYGTGVDKVNIRTADHPEGPWSAATQETLPGCGTTYGVNTCRAVIGHADYSDSSNLAITYFHFSDQGSITTREPGGGTGTHNPGQIRRATIPWTDF